MIRAIRAIRAIVVKRESPAFLESAVSVGRRARKVIWDCVGKALRASPASPVLLVPEASAAKRVSSLLDPPALLVKKESPASVDYRELLDRLVKRASAGSRVKLVLLEIRATVVTMALTAILVAKVIRAILVLRESPALLVR